MSSTSSTRTRAAVLCSTAQSPQTTSRPIWRSFSRSADEIKGGARPGRANLGHDGSGEARDAEVASRTRSGTRRNTIEAGAAWGSADRALGSRARGHEPRAKATPGSRGRARSEIRWSSRAGEVEVASSGRAHESTAETDREEKTLAALRCIWRREAWLEARVETGEGPSAPESHQHHGDEEPRCRGQHDAKLWRGDGKRDQSPDGAGDSGHDHRQHSRQRLKDVK